MMRNYCPSTHSATLDRTKSLGCDQIYKYHCMRNKEDDMVEKCMEFSWIQKGNCAVYDTDAQTIDAWPCSVTLGVCPKEQYQSQQVMSYSACVPLLHSTNSTDGRNANEVSNRNRTDVDDTGKSLMIAIVTCLAVIGIVVLAAVMYWRWKRKRNHGEDEENTVPLMEMDFNHGKYEEEEKIKYLEKEQEHLKYFGCRGYCPEHMLETIKSHLQNSVNVLILGKPGSGQTTIAWTLCKQLHSERFEGQRWFVKASTSTQNLPDDEAVTLVLLLDGRFENAWTTEGMVENCLGELEELRNNLPSKNMLTIATMSHEAHRRISKYGCIDKLYPMEIIDLDSNINSLTTAEMTKVLEMHHIYVKNVKEDANIGMVLSQKQLQILYEYYNSTWIQRKIFTYPNIGFPLLASLMSLNPQFIGDIDFIRKPIKHFLESINQLRESPEIADRNKYCTIVYALLNWGYVKTNNVDQDLFMKIAEHHGHPEAVIDPNFYILRKRTATFYEFLHDSLLRALFAAYGTQHMKFVIYNCPLQVLLEYSVLNRQQISNKERMFFLTIRGRYEKALIRRIKHGIVDVRHHRIWEQMDFQEKYFETYFKPF